MHVVQGTLVHMLASWPSLSSPDTHGWQHGQQVGITVSKCNVALFVCVCAYWCAVNGYEGTGRSLSLKLIQQLREQASGAGAGAAGGGSSSGKGLAAATASGGAVGRTFREVTLDEPIR